VAADTSADTGLRRLALLYSPVSERAVLAALLGIEAEIASSLRAGLDHGVAHLRLKWWREECERSAQGRPAHPLTRELLTACGTAPPELAGLVDTATWDLAAATFETRSELSAYCERWAGALLEPAAAHASAAHAPQTPEWVSFGAAMREIEMLLQVDSEARAGRLRLPLDELDAAGVAAESVAVGTWPQPLAALLSKRHEALRSTLAHGVAGIPPASQPALRGILVWAALLWQRSQGAQHALPDRPRASRARALAEGWSAWRAARGAMRGRFRFM
jgi:phytoene synthase